VQESESRYVHMRLLTMYWMLDATFSLFDKMKAFARAFLGNRLSHCLFKIIGKGRNRRTDRRKHAWAIKGQRAKGQNSVVKSSSKSIMSLEL
jgi:hypothetical protein